MSAIDDQVGGDHYREMAIQPVTFITKNRLGFAYFVALTASTSWTGKAVFCSLAAAGFLSDQKDSTGTLSSAKE